MCFGRRSDRGSNGVESRGGREEYGDRFGYSTNRGHVLRGRECVASREVQCHDFETVGRCHERTMVKVRDHQRSPKKRETACGVMRFGKRESVNCADTAVRAHFCQFASRCPSESCTRTRIVLLGFSPDEEGACDSF